MKQTGQHLFGPITMRTTVDIDDDILLAVRQPPSTSLLPSRRISSLPSRTRPLGHRQITGAYLLALAVKHDGRFVTQDHRLSITTARHAQERHLVVLG